MRNILLFIDNGPDAGKLVKKALKIAYQCKANLQLCFNMKTRLKRSVLVEYGDEELSMERDDFTNIEDITLELAIKRSENEFVPKINRVEINNFNIRTIQEMVVRDNIWLIIIDDQKLQLKNSHPENSMIKMIGNLNCPVMLLSQAVDLTSFNKIAYITDLRYCDMGVIRFLKVFNAPIFVTHISAPGLPDMEERYAQEILSETVSVKANYTKIFLRNIKNKNVQASVTKIFDELEITMFAFVNNKHQTFERLYDNFPDKTQAYHNLPALIFPYLNWFNQPSFYN
jgi:hypothetical protein